jgi:hypothetical protein
MNIDKMSFTQRSQRAKAKLFIKGGGSLSDVELLAERLRVEIDADSRRVREEMIRLETTQQKTFFALLVEKLKYSSLLQLLRSDPHSS